MGQQCHQRPSHCSLSSLSFPPLPRSLLGNEITPARVLKLERSSNQCTATPDQPHHSIPLHIAHCANCINRKCPFIALLSVCCRCHCCSFFFFFAAVSSLFCLTFFFFFFHSSSRLDLMSVIWQLAPLDACPALTHCKHYQQQQQHYLQLHHDHHSPELTVPMMMMVVVVDHH